MKKINLLILLLLVPIIVFAEPDSLLDESSETNNSADIVYEDTNVLSNSAVEENKSFSNNNPGENIVLFNDGRKELNKCKFEKTGDSSDKDADLYGTNSAILVNGGTLSLNGGKVETSASYANGIFSYSEGTIYVNGLEINTFGNNSGGVMVAGGGTLSANKCEIKTSGKSSAAIKSAKGGGYLTVNEGTYKTSGADSPVVYSMANIVINNAELTSTVSEGVVIEGNSSVILNNSSLVDTNTALSKNSETYKNIFLYKSNSGDEEDNFESKTASFTSRQSNITTNNGDTFFVTNTDADISLINSNITNNSGNLLRIQKSKWGKKGSNGGNVVLNLTNQKIKGNIIIDKLSTLEAILDDDSILVGSINSEQEAKKVKIKLSSDSILSLTADTYIDSLENEATDNKNIYANGRYKLYVNNKEVTINKNNYSIEKGETKASIVTKLSSGNNIYIFTLILLLLTIVMFIAVNKKRKQKMHRYQ